MYQNKSTKISRERFNLTHDNTSKETVQIFWSNDKEIITVLSEIEIVVNNFKFSAKHTYCLRSEPISFPNYYQTFP